MFVFSDRVHETNSTPALLVRVHQLVDRRLGIARMGLEDVRKHLAAGATDDAEMILGKVNEDLLLLRQRLRSEIETAVPRSCVLHGLASTASQSN
jgi:hypothetical protein